MLEYLLRTNNMRITYVEKPGGNTKLSAWIEADHGTCCDTHRSVSGGAVMMRKVPSNGFPEPKSGSANVIRRGVCGGLRGGK